MKHIMLDLETMGSGPDAAIIAIGAVLIDITAPEWSKIQKFYTTVNLESSVADGGTIDPGTVIWWLKQSKEAQEAVVESEGQLPIRDAINEFTRWCGGMADQLTTCVWGNGASFDNVILSRAILRSGGIVPWKFRNDRCYRTLKNLYPDVPFVHDDVRYNALDDALAQTNHLLEICSKKGIVL